MSKRTSLFRFTLIVLLAGAGLVLIRALLPSGANADWNQGLAAYERGDYATALRAWQPLAEQGIAMAQHNLGLMYREAKGVSKDDKTAAEWYERAAEQGYANAQSNLGALYYAGRGVPQDDKIALQWFRRAAEQGLAIAQSSLGGMHATGKGVPQDYVHAHMWADIAASGGDKNAVELRNLIEQEMTPSQIAEAQKLARECVRKAYRDC